MGAVVFTKDDVGCFSDNIEGESGRRSVLAELLFRHQPEDAAPSLRNALLSSPIVGNTDEEDAMDILQTLTASGLTWGIVDDQLMLEQTETESELRK